MTADPTATQTLELEEVGPDLAALLTTLVKTMAYSIEQTHERYPHWAELFAVIGQTLEAGIPEEPS